MPYAVVMDLDGEILSKEEIDILVHPNVAGVLLFTRNIRNREQLTQLTYSIHAHRPDVMIMIDHEGGYVQRIQRMGFTPLMSAGWHGRIFDENAQTGLRMAQQAGYTMAKELLECGIDLSLAPVLDLHCQDSKIIGQLDRSFHANPDIVIQLASAYIEGMHEAGMPAVGKHFPGHGTCVGDSHKELPKNNQSEQTLRETDLKPFIALIKNGLLDGVMPAHVIYTAIDNHYAAGYSKRWLQDCLTHELHFDGMIISDCLGMAGADIGDLNTRAQQALTAGCHVLIVANRSRQALKEFVTALHVEHDQKTMQRIEQFRHKIKKDTSAQTHQQRDGHHHAHGEAFPSSQPVDCVFDPQNPTRDV